MKRHLTILTLIGIMLSPSQIFAADADIEKESEGGKSMHASFVDIKSCKLPKPIENYVEASNSHKVPSIVTCFTMDAVVHDEGQEFNGRDAIEEWVNKTITHYNFRFNPLAIKQEDTMSTVVMEVSGSFDGSPIRLNYYFTFQDEKIQSLNIG